MLTQGYRDFEWKQLLSNDSTILTFQPERGLEISGRVANLSNRPISNGTVTLIPSNGGPVLSSKSDSKGLFHFSNLVFTDTTHVVLSAVNAKGGNWTKITYFNMDHESPAVSEQPYAFHNIEDTNMLIYFEKTKKLHEEMINYGPDKVKMLNP